VPIEPLDPARLQPYVGEERVCQLVDAAASVRDALGDRRLLNVNSTAHGGGVAEMLHTLLGYIRHVGIQSEWLVIGGDAPFFQVTKRIHNGLYGASGDGGDLGGKEHSAYQRVLREAVPSIERHVRRGDIVIVHDPQPAGIVGGLVELGATVVWRCHIGVDRTNEWSERAWSFLRRYVEQAHAYVFSKEEFAPAWIAPGRLEVVPPSIDPFSPKNVDLSPSGALSLLAGSGFVSASGVSPASVRRARFVRDGGPPAVDTPLVVQVSRWDRMKDMVGVIRGFVDGVSHSTGTHLVLAGPAVDGVDDDPEARQIWDECVACWHALPPRERARTHLASVPMDDLTENARVINALQRHATVVVQKSLAEGFGLTVAEAMWKARPVVASAIGGIVDQITDGETGFLCDPTDLETFGARVTHVLENHHIAAQVGENARRRVAASYLPDRHLLQYAGLFERLLTRQGVLPGNPL
jgi:trehalose synthase